VSSVSSTKDSIGDLVLLLSFPEQVFPEGFGEFGGDGDLLLFVRGFLGELGRRSVGVGD